MLFLDAKENLKHYLLDYLKLLPKHFLNKKHFKKEWKKFKRLVTNKSKKKRSLKISNNKI